MTSTSKYIWWENQKSTPFYFFKKSLSLSELKGYYSYATSLNSIVQEYYKHLIPLIYEIDYTMGSESPNIFNFEFSIGFNHNEYEIINAKLKSSYDST